MKQLFSATYAEEKFCGRGKWSSSGHKERKRKICIFCRERIRVQRRCEVLEVSFTGFSEISVLRPFRESAVCSELYK